MIDAITIAWLAVTAICVVWVGVIIWREFH